MSESDKRLKMMEKIRALIAKAESTDNEAEKDTFLAAADRLMTEYAVAEHEIRVLKPGQVSAEVKLVKYDLTSGAMAHLAQGMSTLAFAVADFCRLRTVTYGMGHPRYGTKVGCVGFPDDLEYFEMLFTSLKIHALSHLSPRKDPDESDGAYIYRAKAGGLTWAEINYRLGVINDPRVHVPRIHGPYLMREYKKYAKAHDLPTTGANPQNFQANWMEAYGWHIFDRLGAIKRIRENESVGTGLVLVSMKEAVDDGFKEIFSGTKWTHVKDPNRKLNTSARAAGRSAADKADLGLTRIGNSPKGELG